MHPTDRTPCVLAGSIDGFSQLLAQDETAAVDLLEAYEQLLTEVMHQHGGTLLRRTGDEAIVSFTNAPSAVRAAFALEGRRQELIAGAEARRTTVPLLKLGIGRATESGSKDASAGDGAGVTAPGEADGEALRLEAEAPPGTVGVTESILSEVRGTLDYTCSSLGELYRSGRPGGVPAYALRQAGAPSADRDATAGGDQSETASADTNGRSATRDLPRSMYPDRRGAGDDREDHEAEAAWDQALATPRGEESEGADPLLAEYVEQTREAADQTTAGFRGHAAAFAGVNIGLGAVWVATGAGFPWFLFPLFGWGIGLASHWEASRRRAHEVADLKQIPVETREQLQTYRKLAGARGRWRGHLVSTIATSALLFTINMVVSPTFPWFLFPVGGMGIGLATHYPSYRAKARRLRERIRELALPGALVNADRSPGRRRHRSVAEAGPSAEAQALRAAILGDVDRSSGLDRRDFESVLDEFVSRITSLSHARDELARSADRTELAATESELAELRAGRDASEDKTVRSEYERSIAQLERQQNAYTEVLRDQELLELRLRQAVNSLKEMRVHVARTAGLSASEGLESLEALKRRSEELSHYLADMHSAYDELSG